MFLSMLHKGKGGALGFFSLSPHPTKSPSSPHKITYSMKGMEYRTLTHHPLCYEVLVT